MVKFVVAHLFAKKISYDRYGTANIHLSYILCLVWRKTVIFVIINEKALADCNGSCQSSAPLREWLGWETSYSHLL